MLARKIIGQNQRADIEFVGARAVGARSGSAVDLTGLTGGVASSPSANDLVIVYAAQASVGAQPITITGYTEVFSLHSNDITDTNLTVGYKFMGSTPDTVASLTTDGTVGGVDNAVGFLVQVWRNVDAITPMDVSATSATGIDSVLCDPPSIAPITFGSVIVSGGAGAHRFGSGTFSSSDLTDFRSAVGVDTYDLTIGGGYKQWTGGAFNPAAFTFSGTDATTYSWAAATLALRPAPA